MCSRGYSNKFSGLAVTLLISVGLVGSVIAGVITEITGRLEEVAKFWIRSDLVCETMVSLQPEGEHRDPKDKDSFAEEDV